MREKNEKFSKWLEKEREGQLVLSHTIYEKRKVELVNNMYKPAGSNDTDNTIHDFSRSFGLTYKPSRFGGMPSNSIHSFHSNDKNRVIFRHLSRARA